MKKFKNIAIILLMALAFIQLSTIWNINVKNIFTTSYDVAVTQEQLDEILIPNKILVNDGVKYKIAYDTKSNRNSSRSVLYLLKDILNDGKYEGNVVNISDVVKQADVIYKYPNIINHDLMSNVLNIKNTSFSKNDVAFNEIYIIDDENAIYFYNTQSKMCQKFSLDNLIIRKNYTFNDNLAYEYDQNISSYLSPIVIDDEYYNIVQNNPYGENDEVLATTVESKINRFFKSPNEKWTIFGDDSYTFSGEEITVKYYNKNILEYKNNYVSNKKTDYQTAYAIAKDFIVADSLITNDIILKKSEVQENSYKFAFNPIVNNTEIVFDNDDLDYYIEIEVTNGIVKHYKKYVLNYSLNYINVNYIENNVFDVENDFDTFELVYLQNINENKLDLSWAMHFGDDTVYTFANYLE